MIKRVYSLFDEKSGIYANPVYLTTDGEALRVLSDLLEDPKSTVSRHSSDYKLYFVGTFDAISGNFKGLPEPKFLANASDFVKVPTVV